MKSSASLWNPLEPAHEAKNEDVMNLGISYPSQSI